MGKESSQSKALCFNKCVLTLLPHLRGLGDFRPHCKALPGLAVLSRPRRAFGGVLWVNVDFSSLVPLAEEQQKVHFNLNILLSGSSPLPGKKWRCVELVT